jgi:hypothetical protein
LLREHLKCFNRGGRIRIRKHPDVEKPRRRAKNRKRYTHEGNDGSSKTGFQIEPKKPGRRLNRAARFFDRDESAPNRGRCGRSDVNRPAVRRGQPLEGLANRVRASGASESYFGSSKNARRDAVVLRTRVIGTDSDGPTEPVLASDHRSRTADAVPSASVIGAY